jgi:signal transduction histidine kinase
MLNIVLPQVAISLENAFLFDNLNQEIAERKRAETVQTSVFSIGDAIERKEMERVDRALSLAARNIRRCDGIITELLDFTRQEELKRHPWISMSGWKIF